MMRDRLITLVVVFILACCGLSACSIGGVLLYQSGEVTLPKSLQGITIPKGGIPEGLSLNPSGGNTETLASWLESQAVVFVSFTADNCRECETMRPAVQAAQTLRAEAQFLEVNLSSPDGKAAARSVDVLSAAPTYAVFNRGKKIGTIIGARYSEAGDPDAQPLIALIDEAALAE